MWRQPKAVWAVAFASVVAFMGIGLVDPILKPIADNLNASASRRGRIRTADLVLPKHAGFQATPRADINFKAPSGSRTRTSAMARQQATATSWAHRITGRIVKEQSTGWDSNPRCRITGAVSSPLNDQSLSPSGAGGTRTHIDRFKRPVHRQFCHNPDC